ncbi:hypothetical protein KAR91_43950 [Candidatus Pacearchaeota archaeon]|nr:hypothetical protein [Candidatus Pacearchaeota archaeon]
MSGKRKVDLIENSEDFRNYVSEKNTRARKMLEVYDGLTEGIPKYFMNDEYSVGLTTKDDVEIIKHQSVDKCAIQIQANKSNRGKVKLDTGVISIRDDGQMSDTGGLKCMNTAFMNGSHALIEAAEEFNRVAGIYKSIFGDRYIKSKFFK